MLKVNDLNSMFKIYKLGQVEGWTFFSILSNSKFYFQKTCETSADMIINLGLTPLLYVCPRKYTVDIKDLKDILIKSVNDKCQITATFAVSALPAIFTNATYLYR